MDHVCGEESDVFLSASALDVMNEIQPRPANSAANSVVRPI